MKSVKFPFEEKIEFPDKAKSKIGSNARNKSSELQKKIGRDSNDLKDVEKNVQAMNLYLSTSDTASKTKIKESDLDIDVQDCLRVKEIARKKALDMLAAIKQKAELNEKIMWDQEEEKNKEREENFDLLRESASAVAIHYVDSDKSPGKDQIFLTRGGNSEILDASPNHNKPHKIAPRLGTELEDAETFLRNREEKRAPNTLARTNNNSAPRPRSASHLPRKFSARLDRNHVKDVEDISAEVAETDPFAREHQSENVEENEKRVDEIVDKGGWADLPLAIRQDIWLKKRQAKMEEIKRGKEEEAVKEVTPRMI